MKEKEIAFPRKLTFGNFNISIGQTFKIKDFNITVSEFVNNKKSGYWDVICHAGEGENRTSDFIWKRFSGSLMIEADIDEILSK